MKRTLGVLIPMFLLFPLPLHGQEGPPAELEHLNVHVGEWTFSASNGTSGTQVCEKYGDYFVRCEMEMTNPDGSTVNGLDVMGYDAVEGVFTWHRFYTDGYRGVAKGWREDGTWTFLYEGTGNTKYRQILVEESANVRSSRVERFIGSGQWEVVSEGRSTKGG